MMAKKNEAVEESAEAVEESAEAVEQSAEAVEQSAEAVEESAKAVEESAKAVEESAKAVEKSAEAVEKSAEAVEQPSGVNTFELGEKIGKLELSLLASIELAETQSNRILELESLLQYATDQINALNSELARVDEKLETLLIVEREEHREESTIGDLVEVEIPTETKSNENEEPKQKRRYLI